jgi:fucose 4-O-acetylase-like acetyltransferase
MPKERTYYIDNIRVLLTILIVLHHLAITYGAPGGWYYQEGLPGFPSLLLYAMFTSINQAFIMGFFFLLSGYFTPGSYDRKGAGPFLEARLLRLGIPLLFYILAIDPLITYARAVVIRGFTGSIIQYFGDYFGGFHGLGTGPLWFVEALLIFNCFYVLWRLISKGATRDFKVPGNTTFVLVAILLGVVTFAVRIWLPMGWTFAPLGLQFPYFPQYIGMFVIGMIAYRGNWLEHLTVKMGRLWLWIAIILALLLPVLFFVAAPGGDDTYIRGGFHWQSFAFSLWEQLLCVALVVALTVLFREKRNRQGKLGRSMAASAYTAYIFHAPIIVLLAFGLRSIEIELILKFVLVAPLAIFLCFSISTLIRKLPFTRRIL